METRAEPQLRCQIGHKSSRRWKVIKHVPGTHVNTVMGHSHEAIVSNTCFLQVRLKYDSPRPAL